MSHAARLACLLCLALMPPLPAEAHVDSNTAQNYRGYDRNDGRGSCCNWLDCRPAFAPVMEPDGETIMDRALNKFRFDPAKIVPRPSDDGNWHVCGSGSMIWCIIAPAQVKREPDPADRLFGFSLVGKSTPEDSMRGATLEQTEHAVAALCEMPAEAPGGWQ